MFLVRPWYLTRCHNNWLVEVLARVEVVTSAEIARVGVIAAAAGTFLERIRLVALIIASTILERAFLSFGARI